MHNGDMVRDFVIAVLVVGLFSGFVIAVGLYYLLPWIWSYLKPIIQVLVA